MAKNKTLTRHIFLYDSLYRKLLYFVKLINSFQKRRFMENPVSGGHVSDAYPSEQVASQVVVPEGEKAVIRVDKLKIQIYALGKRGIGMAIGHNQYWPHINWYVVVHPEDRTAHIEEYTLGLPKAPKDLKGVLAQAEHKDCPDWARNALRTVLQTIDDKTTRVPKSGASL